MSRVFRAYIFEKLVTLRLDRRMSDEFNVGHTYAINKYNIQRSFL